MKCCNSQYRQSPLGTLLSHLVLIAQKRVYQGLLLSTVSFCLLCPQSFEQSLSVIPVRTQLPSIFSSQTATALCAIALTWHRWAERSLSSCIGDHCSSALSSSSRDEAMACSSSAVIFIVSNWSPVCRMTYDSEAEL